MTENMYGEEKYESRAVLYVHRISGGSSTRREKAQMLSAMGRELLAQGVREVWGIKELPEIRKNENGKPFFFTCPEICFNISHSGNIAVCVLAGIPIGVDIQIAEKNSEKILKRFGGEPLYKSYLLSGEKEEFFLRWWTREESYAKWLGSSLGKCIGKKKRETYFQTFFLDKHYCCTVCSGQTIELTIREV